jgi:phosphatidylethanolamine-binding protein (PEBP) family uncharacterized protein
MSTTDAATATTTYDWSVYNIPPTVTSIPENDSAAAGTIGGTNPDFEYRYRGPCATTAGTHEYHIKVYALSADLNAVVEKPVSTPRSTMTLVCAQKRSTMSPRMASHVP